MDTNCILHNCHLSLSTSGKLGLKACLVKEQINCSINIKTCIANTIQIEVNTITTAVISCVTVGMKWGQKPFSQGPGFLSPSASLQLFCSLLYHPHLPCSPGSKPLCRIMTVESHFSDTMNFDQSDYFHSSPQALTQNLYNWVHGM